MLNEIQFIKFTTQTDYLILRRRSLVDGRPMDGISSIRMMQSGPDYSSKSHMIKWTEVFILPSLKECTENADYTEPPDPSRITSHIAKAISMALLPHLKQLKKEDLSPLAVKVCLDPENVRFGKNFDSIPVYKYILSIFNFKTSYNLLLFLDKL